MKRRVIGLKETQEIGSLLRIGEGMKRQGIPSDSSILAIITSEVTTFCAALVRVALSIACTPSISSLSSRTLPSSCFESKRWYLRSEGSNSNKIESSPGFAGVAVTV
jgi:hypothetical protein